MKWWEQIGDGQRQSPPKRRSVYETRNLARAAKPDDGDEDREGWVPIERFVPFGSGSPPVPEAWPPRFTPLDVDHPPEGPVGHQGESR